MKKKFSADEWINLLLDGNLTEEQQRQLEAWLVMDPTVETLTGLRQTKKLNKLLQDIAKQCPDVQNPDALWLKLKERLEPGPPKVSWNERFLWWLSFDRWKFPTIAAMALCVAVGLGVFWFLKPAAPSQFVEVDHVRGSDPSISATAYHSKSANATVVWVSGYEKGPSQFGQIWQVYSFRPDVFATAYDSQEGNATVIWVSGLDDQTEQPDGASS